jgi:hypothetical protein
MIHLVILIPTPELFIRLRRRCGRCGLVSLRTQVPENRRKISQVGGVAEDIRLLGVKVGVITGLTDIEGI